MSPKLVSLLVVDVFLTIDFQIELTTNALQKIDFPAEQNANESLSTSKLTHCTLLVPIYTETPRSHKVLWKSNFAQSDLQAETQNYSFKSYVKCKN